MDSNIYAILVQLAGIIVAVFGGGALVPAVAWLKRITGAEGYGSIAIMVIASVIFATAELLIAGQITPDITADNFGAIVVAVIAGSQVVYRMLRDRRQA